MTQRDLGALVDVSGTTVDAWEQGRFRFPSPHTFDLLQARAYWKAKNYLAVAKVLEQVNPGQLRRQHDPERRTHPAPSAHPGP